ncbi:MAG: SPOR domain-containing protein [Halioglobus sp.]|nr:SPOR domain-containing protein [Halioglobus sp.]
MTVKDLHFSFDGALAKAQVPANEQAAPSARERREALQRPPAKKTRNKAQGTGEASARRAWITASFVSLVNMAFLVLAGLWLTGTHYQIPGLAGFIAPLQDEGPGPAIQELPSGLDATAGQLAELRAAVAAQSELLIAIQAQLARSREAQEIPVATAAVEASVPAAPSEVPAPTAKDWQINLGSFSSAQGAMKLQAELASMGYAAQVSQPGDPGEIAYRVWMGGYENRAAADTVAHQLMDQTSLTGLWVWNGQ